MTLCLAPDHPAVVRARYASRRARTVAARHALAVAGNAAAVGVTSEAFGRMADAWGDRPTSGRMLVMYPDDLAGPGLEGADIRAAIREVEATEEAAALATLEADHAAADLDREAAQLVALTLALEEEARTTEDPAPDLAHWLEVDTLSAGPPGRDWAPLSTAHASTAPPAPSEVSVLLRALTGRRLRGRVT